MKADFFQQENLDLCSFLIQLVSICSWRMFATLATRSGKCSAVMVPASGPGLQPGVIAKPGRLEVLDAASAVAGLGGIHSQKTDCSPGALFVKTISVR